MISYEADAHPSGVERSLSVASSWSVSFSFPAKVVLAGQSAHTVSELHRSSYLDGKVSPVFSSFDQLRIGDPLAVRSSEKRVDAITFLRIAAVVAPRKFVQVAVEMFGADEMMDAENLPL